MSTWILAVYLTSVNGSFIKEFNSEKACVLEMRRVALDYEKTGNANLRSISCTPAEE